MIAELFADPQNLAGATPRPYRGDREVELTLDQEAQPEWDISKAYDEALKKCAMVDRCVWGKAAKAGSLPLRVWERKEGSSEGALVSDHPIEELLNYPSRDNIGSREEMTARASQHYDLTGNSLVGIVRARNILNGGANDPVELVSEDPREVYPVPTMGKRGRITLGQWNYRDSTGQTKAWDPSDMIQWKRHNPANRFWGRTVLESLSMTVDSSVEGQRTHLLRVARDGRPGMILADPSIVSPEKGREAEDLLNSRMRHRRGGIMLLHGAGETAQKLITAGMSTQDLGILESMAFDRDMIAIAFGYLPAGFSTDAATYDNVGFFILHEWSLVQELMSSWCSRLTAYLIPREDRRRFYIAPDYSGVHALEEVALDRLKMLKDLSFTGASYNDIVRGARLPLPVRSDGDVPLVPQTMVPLAKALAPPAPA